VQTTAAVLWERNTPWSIEEIELDEPRQDEVLVELHASGMCHSDEHIVTGDMPFRLPCIGGHEGAGVVKQVGPGVSWLSPGDHVVFSFMPSCGRCPSCSTGHQSLCDLGARLYSGRQISDGTARHHARGQDLATACLIGSFAHHTVVHEASCVKIEPQFPLDKACLLGCGFITGWGSAVYAADIRPGDAVVVAGVGGIGAAAIQGARLAGAKVIVAIDPNDSKKDKAIEFGATHVASSWEDAPAVVAEATWNRGADRFICAMGVGEGHLIKAALRMTAKRGRVVVTNIHRAAETSIDVSLMDLTLSEKQIVGTLYGSANARADIPKLLELWGRGQVDLDSMVSRTYPLEGVNDGYADMRAGRNLRGVLTYPALQA
jgi:NDMA-dependent alcohol dehydrogenase